MADDGDDEEIEEITPENIKKLAKQAGGGGDDEEEDDEEEEASDAGGAAASAGGGGGQVNVQVERLDSSIDMLKDQNSSAMDRIQTVSQNMGEIRQMVNEQERSVSSIEADVNKLQDAVDGIEPQEFKKQISDLRASIESNKADMKKMGEKVDRALQLANDVQETLNNLGSMDNLIELNKEFEQKISEIKEAERYIERLASKSEQINVRINKKMSEYNTYKAMVDTLQEKTSDMFQKLDEVEIEVEDAVTEDEMGAMRERIHELEEQLEEYSKIAPLAEMSLPQPIVELRQKRKDIEEFLEELEQQYANDKLSTSEYQKIKEANEDKLDNINQKLVEAWKNVEEAAEGGGPEGGPEPTGEEESSDEENGSGGEPSPEPEESDEDTEDEEEPDEYEELLQGSVEDVKEGFKQKNLDAEKLLEMEQDGQNRDSLVEWLQSKTGE